MFYGEHVHVLDAKGRLQLPSKFRRKLEEKAGGDDKRFQVIVTKGEDFCLQVYPQDAWTQKQEAVLALDTASRDSREYRRAFFSGADELEADAQGRVLLRDQLRGYAHITKDCAVVGCGEYFEIWSLADWERERNLIDDAIGKRDEPVRASGS